MKKIISIILTLIIFISANSQVSRVDPPNWWTGMNISELQLMVYGNNLSQFIVKVNYPGVELTSVEKAESPNYLFINLNIAKDAQPGKVELKFYKNEKLAFTYMYELWKRDDNSAMRESFSTRDVFYLIMPDRFSNGDTLNDSRPEMTEKHDRSNPNGRHGGDIQGIINHLDYIKDMGFTTLWLTPFQENNLTKYTYHGYATSDYYKVDPRYGSNELYKTLSIKCKEKSLKLVIDAVTNHSSTTYYWMKDLPMQSWFNNYPNYRRTNFQGTVWSDPYCSLFDLKKMADGWFDSMMADMNQKNPFVAKYLIQNSMWWIEFAKLDGVRSDTHMYNDRDFISSWAKTILSEYPKLNIVGEVMLNRPAFTAYWQKDSKVAENFNSYLPTVMDFPLFFSYDKAFNGENPNSINALYYILNEDFLYTNTNNLMLVVDNHDVSRIFSIVKKDYNKYKMVLSFLATTRGIPQFYYGSEILFEGDKEIGGDPALRKDFPGSWKNDSTNAFSGKGLTSQQADAQQFVKKLLNWRKTNDAVINGKLTHFIPEDGVYVYFRYTPNSKVMVLLNNNKEDKTIDLTRFSEMLQGYSTGLDVITGEKIENLQRINLKGLTASIIELH